MNNIKIAKDLVKMARELVAESGTQTPWGLSQSAKQIVRGITVYGTANHGGICVAPVRPNGSQSLLFPTECAGAAVIGMKRIALQTLCFMTWQKTFLALKAQSGACSLATLKKSAGRALSAGIQNIRLKKLKKSLCHRQKQGNCRKAILFIWKTTINTIQSPLRK